MIHGPHGMGDNYSYWNEWPSTADPQYDWNLQTNYWFTCPQCSKLVQWGSAHCPNCGYKLIQEETDADKLKIIIQKLDEIIQLLKEKEND